jgi:hypothetical protein
MSSLWLCGSVIPWNMGPMTHKPLLLLSVPSVAQVRKQVADKLKVELR